MQRLDVHVEREPKHSRNDREKITRLAILFCVIAAITALIIYLIIPSKSSDAAAEEAVENVENTADVNQDNGNAAAGNNASGSSQPDAGNNSAAADSSKQNSNNSGNAAESGNPAPPSDAGTKVMTAKYNPSDKELFDNTAKLRQMLKDGSWKKKEDIALCHSVKSGDNVYKLTEKYKNSSGFVKEANNLDDKFTIRAGSKLYFLRTGGWQIVISRKNGTLRLDRMINGQPLPFAIFECQINPYSKMPDDLVICSRPNKSEITLAKSNNRSNPNRNFSILTCKDDSTRNASLKKGATILNTEEDISLLYKLAPQGTAVRIVE